MAYAGSKRPQVAIIGSGAVGATCASSMILMDLSVQLLMVDVNVEMAEGQALDLADSTFESSASVRVGTHKEAGQSHIIIITAGENITRGVAGKTDETRMQLLSRNCEILKSVLAAMQPIRSDALILVVADPVDVLTELSWKITGLPQNQVFGTGTLLDTQRLRVMLSKRLDIGASGIHCYELGEHGDCQFPNWDSAIAGGIPLRSYLSDEELEKLSFATATRAYDIIEKKGNTHYGIGSCVAAIIKSVINNQRKIFPVTCYRAEYDCYVSSPASVGATGVFRQIDLNLSKKEREKMAKAVASTKAAIAKAGF